MSNTSMSTPIIYVKKSVAVFTFDATKPIQLGLTPDEAASATTQIEENISQYDAAVQPAITASTKTEDGQTTTDQTIRKAIKNGKREIALSAMSNDFQLKYRKDIKLYDTSDELLKFFKQIFGEYSQRQRENAAKLELANTTRRASDNEPFELFLKRLQSITTNVSTNEEVQKDRLDETFRANLTPALNTFLLEHDQLEQSCVQIAKYLDTKQKHKKSAEINLLEKMDKIDQLEKLILEMKLNQATQMTNLTKMFQESLGANQNSEVNAIQNSPQETKPWKSVPQNKKHCSKCGMFNHRTDQCYGKCRLTCRRCNKIGHLDIVCRMAKN